MSLSSRMSKPMAARAGMLASLASLVLLAGSLAVVAPTAHADDLHTILGAGVGAVAGAAIGNSLGGRNGAIVGAGAGGLVGASIANDGYGYRRSNASVQVYAPAAYPVTYYQQPPMVWQAPQPQYRVVQPVAYYPQPVYRWQVEQPQYRHWREEERHDHGHHYGRHDRDDGPQWGHGEDRRDRRD